MSRKNCVLVPGRFSRPFILGLSSLAIVCSSGLTQDPPPPTGESVAKKMRVPSLPIVPVDFRNADTQAAERIEAGKLILEAVRLGDEAKRLADQGNFGEAEPLARAAVELHRRASGCGRSGFRRQHAQPGGNLCGPAPTMRKVSSCTIRSLKIIEAELGKGFADATSLFSQSAGPGLHELETPPGIRGPDEAEFADP